MVEMAVRLVLGLLLLGAAAAKIASPQRSRDALRTFGFASDGSRTLAWACLIALEAGLAAGVLAGWEEAASLGAATLLLFAAALAGAIVRGKAGEPCGCFGAGSTVGWRGVARNLALAALFVAVVLLPSEELSTEQWLGLGLGVSLLGVAGLGAAVLALAREVGLLRLRVGPASALEIPEEGPELGARTTFAERIEPKPGADLRLAVFTSESCHVCAALAPAIDAVAAHPAVAARRFDEAADSDAWLELGVPGSPYAVAFADDGTVLAKGTFNNLAQLESVLAAAERRRAAAVEVMHA